MNTEVKFKSTPVERTHAIGGLLKRLFDIAFSLFAVIAFAPFVAVIALMHKAIDGGPVFFVHERVGLNGAKFGCLKFRTMIEDADAKLQSVLDSDPAAREEYDRDSKLKEDPRIIPFIGDFLRKSSLDEVPQFFNVLRGEMSVVGPRPVVEREFYLYGSAGEVYSRTRPGITGLWQVSGRNDVSFQDRVEIDRTYVRNWSFFEDVRIIFKTITVVLKRDGAY